MKSNLPLHQKNPIEYLRQAMSSVDELLRYKQSQIEIPGFDTEKALWREITSQYSRNLEDLANSIYEEGARLFLARGGKIYNDSDAISLDDLMLGDKSSAVPDIRGTQILQIEPGAD